MRVCRLLIYEGDEDKIATDLNNPNCWVKGKTQVKGLIVTEKFLAPTIKWEDWEVFVPTGVVR